MRGARNGNRRMSLTAIVDVSLYVLLAGCLLGFCLPSISTALSPAQTPAQLRLAWAVDLVANWQIVFMLVWALACVWLLRRHPGWALMLPVALLPLWTASARLSPAVKGAQPDLTVTVANVNLANRDPARLLAWLRARPADVVVLLELSPAYARALSEQPDYPHRSLLPENNAFGIGIVSRKPLRDVVVNLSASGIPALAATVDAGSGPSGSRPTRIVAAHPMPPLAPKWYDERDALLRQLAAAASGGPLIVAGDLNATPWSSGLRDAHDAGLMRANGLLPTWPRGGRGVFGIPIDHVLANAHWRRGDSVRGPDIGSDHYPLRVALHWAEPTARD
jgi:endonuclease/exonuclease/phosphatase (EEP) superfamily protein YafD